jgi:hypothetical protein
MKNIKYKYLITYNKRIKYKKCNDEFFYYILIVQINKHKQVRPNLTSKHTCQITNI